MSCSFLEIQFFMRLFFMPHRVDLGPHVPVWTLSDVVSIGTVSVNYSGFVIRVTATDTHFLHIFSKCIPPRDLWPVIVILLYLLTYALSLPVCHRPQTTSCLHSALFYAAVFIFLQLCLKPAVHISTYIFPGFWAFSPYGALSIYCSAGLARKCK